MLQFLMLNCRFLFFVGALYLTVVFVAPASYSSDTAEHDCIKCHNLTNKDAMGLLQGRIGISDAKVIEVLPSHVKGLWEIAFETEGKKVVGYLDFAKEKILFGNIFQINTRTNLTAERLSALNKVDLSQISLSEALVMGDRNADKKVIVFTDPD